MFVCLFAELQFPEVLKWDVMADACQILCLSFYACPQWDGHQGCFNGSGQFDWTGVASLNLLSKMAF